LQAVFLKWVNQFEEASAMQKQSLAILEKTFGKDHPKLALSLSNIANCLK
jgi:Tetratricopeptide repeat